MVTPAAHREAAGYLQSTWEMSERRACRVIGIDRTSVRYQATRPDDGALRERGHTDRRRLNPTSHEAAASCHGQARQPLRARARAPKHGAGDRRALPLKMDHPEGAGHFAEKFMFQKTYEISIYGRVPTHIGLLLVASAFLIFPISASAETIELRCTTTRDYSSEAIVTIDTDNSTMKYIGTMPAIVQGDSVIALFIPENQASPSLFVISRIDLSFRYDESLAPVPPEIANMPRTTPQQRVAVVNAALTGMKWTSEVQDQLGRGHCQRIQRAF